MRGTVKWFDEKKGFGFISPDEKKKRDIFVHYSGILGEGYKKLEQDQRVEFEIEQTAKGPQAVEVQVIA